MRPPAKSGQLHDPPLICHEITKPALGKTAGHSHVVQPFKVSFCLFFSMSQKDSGFLKSLTNSCNAIIKGFLYREVSTKPAGNGFRFDINVRLPKFCVPVFKINRSAGKDVISCHKAAFKASFKEIDLKLQTFLPGKNNR